MPMEYIKPKKLIPGQSIVGLISPSGIAKKHGLETGIKILRDWGFSVKLGKHIKSNKDDYSAGTDVERAEDFLQMVFNQEVSAIGCIVGGFAAGGILKMIKPRVFNSLRKNPKIFFGYSDFSLILNTLFSQGFISLHAPNLSGLYQRSLGSQKSLKLSLLGDLPAEIGPLADWDPIKPGFAEGRLLVSNLEALVNLLGTPFDPLNSGNDNLILALEEVGENKSTITRWLETLALHSQVKRIRGIILGRFTKIGETAYPIWGQEMSVEQIFLKIFGPREILLASLPEFGHIEEKRKILPSKRREKIDFLSLPLGVKVSFEVKTESCRLIFQEKAII